MCDLEQRIYVIKINVPKFKDVDLFRVQHREVYACPACAE